MQLFNKPLEKWTKDDLESIIKDSDYNEKLHVDYKEEYNLYKIPKAKIPEREKEKNETRNDICSFANADGGYIIYGIKEEKGVPIEITDSNIDDKDKFELEIRNIISKIEPVVPTIEIIEKEIDSEKKVQIIKIYKGIHTPYTHSGNNNYYFFVRDGNGKRLMSYKEVQTMYNQSIILTNEIQAFCEARYSFIKQYGLVQSTKVAIIDIIPSTFLDDATFTYPYLLLKKNRIDFIDYFAYHCNGDPEPNLDGMCYKSGDSTIMFQIFNSNIIEKAFKIEDNLDNVIQERIIDTNELDKNIGKMTRETVAYYKKIELSAKVYLCTSVYGCGGLVSQICSEHFGSDICFIDRQKIICKPVEIYDINDDECVKNSIKQQKISLCLALGIKKLGILFD